MVSLPSYTRNTTDLLSKLEGIYFNEGTLLASINVEAFYSSIPHHAGLAVVQYYLDMRIIHVLLHNEFILRLLAFALEHNFFLFDGRFYCQFRGTAMGSVCMPTNANLLLGLWEVTIVFREEMDSENNKILLWARYIDNIFVL